MADKVTFNFSTRTIEPNGPVDGLGRIILDLQVDVYSDGKDDWLADPDLNRFRFPVEAIGGNETPLGKLGTTYVLLNGWQIDPTTALGPYELQINGNVVTDDGRVSVLSREGVSVVQNVSTLVEVREIYEQALEDIRKLMLNAFETDPVTGTMRVYDDDGETVVLQADVWEDINRTQKYRGRGIERRDPLE